MENNMVLLPQQPITPLQGKSNEWYTPAYIIEAARQVLGTIDLDPASCEQANQVVRATRFYSAKDNGLEHDWHGNVWLNPPYSSTQGATGREGSRQGLAKPFIFRLIDEYQQGNVQQAILLVTSDTDASWFRPLWEYPICFADYKVMFHRPGKSKEGQFFGTSFVYLGTNEQTFIREFSKFGHIAKSIAGPRHETEQARLWGVA